MKRINVNVMGMELERWEHESCSAEFGVGEDEEGKWATLYSISSKEEGQGHATELLKAAKTTYESLGMRFGGSVALNDRMRSIYQRLGITEYK
jgi:hypothetical protein